VAVAGRVARFLPNLGEASRATLRGDLVAALDTAALALPQGLAFALLAGVPPEMGLLACALPAVVASLFGSSPYLVTGPTNTNALVIGVAVVGPALAAGRPVPVDAVVTTALLAGALLCAFGLAGLGRASRFLSDSVLAGFVTGAGILIAVRQLPLAAGVGTEGAVQPVSALVPEVWPALLDAARALAAADPRALFLAALVPAAVHLLRRIDARVPAALLALIAAAGAAHALGWDAGPRALVSTGAIPAGWPGLAWPGLVDPGPLAAPALAIALLTTVQSIAAARTLGPPGFRLDPDRELFGQGLANTTAALVGALPTSGSLSRSALVRAAGGRTRLAAAASGVIMLLGLPLVAPFVARVPAAALAGLVILSGLDLVDSRTLRRAAITRGDALVLGATLVATLCLDLVQAVYVGVFLSLALLVRRSGRLQLVEIVFAGANRFREIPTDERTGSTPVVLLHLEGDLNFAVAPELAERFDEIAARAPRIVVLRLKRARHLDATVLEVLRSSFGRLRRRGSEVILCGLTDPIAETLERTELGRALGPEGLLRAGPRLFEGFERALARARELLRPRSDEEIFRSEDPTAWTWEI
jgi:SulP family sulfate permease